VARVANRIADSNCTLGMRFGLDFKFFLILEKELLRTNVCVYGFVGGCEDSLLTFES
jgi:hypothetical protein